jgi:hypothetical protein
MVRGTRRYCTTSNTTHWTVLTTYLVRMHGTKRRTRRACRASRYSHRGTFSSKRTRALGTASPAIILHDRWGTDSSKRPLRFSPLPRSKGSHKTCFCECNTIPSPPPHHNQGVNNSTGYRTCTIRSRQYLLVPSSNEPSDQSPSQVQWC